VAEVDRGPDSTYSGPTKFRLIGDEGGYLGLQIKGNRVDGSLGKMAIFSIWDPEEAAGPGTEGWSA
jgi:hypothetical protein